MLTHLVPHAQPAAAVVGDALPVLAPMHLHNTAYISYLQITAQVDLHGTLPSPDTYVHTAYHWNKSNTGEFFCHLCECCNSMSFIYLLSRHEGFQSHSQKGQRATHLRECNLLREGLNPAQPLRHIIIIPLVLVSTTAIATLARGPPSLTAAAGRLRPGRLLMWV